VFTLFPKGWLSSDTFNGVESLLQVNCARR